MTRWIASVLLAGSFLVLQVSAQAPATGDRGGRGSAPSGPPPTHANIDYAPPDPPSSVGHKLDPARYVSAADPPLVILHGGSDPLVPHNQGERLYMALNKACHESAFISLPTAGHGPWNGFLTSDALRAAATIRTTAAAGCRVTNPTPLTPTWQTVIDFLNAHVK